MKTVFVNVEKCIGCRHCEIACAKEHSNNKDLLSILNDDPQPQPGISVGLGIDFMKFPNRCRHCDPAPCQQICPTGAIYRDEESGSVIVKETSCISCGMCAMVCPFSAITFHRTPAVNTLISYKCDDCIERRKDGREPACAEACKTGALIFGNINEIISSKKQDIVMEITKDIKGIEPSEVPENIRIFQSIKEKLAQLGPMPSSN
ncbi:MAG: 4Fe-4S dicluster domain-containing protein [Thermodesulfobacteriota bacterium]|nr:4Fe-4S dicluster domain-containing protein [Thermodesulfobacteriota bacterium]